MQILANIEVVIDNRFWPRVGQVLPARVPPADPAALARSLGPWYAMKTEVLAGQMLDILAEASGATDEATPARVNRFKTAAYTVERPLHIGAALAGAGADTVSALREFGVAIGQAFQLRDDMLGVYGDPEVTGKPSGDDLREGKRTLLLARGVALASADDADFLLSVTGTDLDAAALERARRVLVDSGAVGGGERDHRIASGERAASNTCICSACRTSHGLNAQGVARSDTARSDGSTQRASTTSLGFRCGSSSTSAV